VLKSSFQTKEDNNIIISGVDKHIAEQAAAFIMQRIKGEGEEERKQEE
jgi:ribosomal protein L6P/L9E